MVQGMSQQAPELRSPTQGELQKNAVSHPVRGLGKRAGTDHIRILRSVSPGSSSWTSFIARDARERYLLSFDGNILRCFTLDGREVLVEAAPGAYAYLSAPNPRQDITSMTLADTTLFLNRTKTTQMGTSVSPTQTPLAVVWIKRGNYSQTYTVTLGTTDYSVTTSDTVPSQTRTSWICDQLRTAVTIAGYTITYNTGDSWFTIRKTDNSAFTISGKDSMSNTGVGVCYMQSNTFADLPPLAPDGYVVKVLGSEGDSIDDYWVKFDADRSDGLDLPKRGVWSECTAPGTVTVMDAATLPHRLSRLQDDTLGTKTGRPFGVYFRLEQCVWDPRSVGDATTSPDPSFIGQTISSLFLYQNRLGLLFKNSVVMSRSGDLFNFFRGTGSQVLDDDPIDINISVGRLIDDRVMDLQHAISFAEELLLIGDRSQVVIPGDVVLTPKTVRATLTTAVEADPWCRPVVVGRTVLLPFNDGTYIGLREMYTLQNRQKDTNMRTGAVPKLMAGRPVKISVCPSESTLILSDTIAPTKLYVYRWLDINNERAQSSWGWWEFGNAVIWHDVIDSTLWLLVDRPEGPTLECMELNAWSWNENCTEPILLDRKIAFGTAQFTSRAGSGPGLGTGSSASDTATPPPTGDNGTNSSHNWFPPKDLEGDSSTGVTEF
jgi:hypothetical protein